MARYQFLLVGLLTTFSAVGCDSEPAADGPPATVGAADVDGAADSNASDPAAASAPGADAAPDQTVDVDATYETPEAAYQAAAQAIDQQNYAQLAALMTDASQQMLAGGLIIGSTFMTMNDEAKDKQLKELLGSYGVDMNMEDAMADELANADPEAMVARLTEPIDNLPRFIGELMAWMEKENEAAGRALPALGELGEVKIDGDTAVAEVQSEEGAQPIEFRRVDGSWQIHLPTGSK